jgi:hypothetical protein
LFFWHILPLIFFDRRFTNAIACAFASSLFIPYPFSLYFLSFLISLPLASFLRISLLQKNDGFAL